MKEDLIEDKLAENKEKSRKLIDQVSEIEKLSKEIQFLKDDWLKGEEEWDAIIANLKLTIAEYEREIDRLKE